MKQIRFRQWVNGQFHYWGVKIGEVDFIGTASGNKQNAVNTAHQQFTGLHDRNGKEIYEGDVLATPHYLDGDRWRYLHHIVEWSDKYAGWWCRNVKAENDTDGCTQLFVLAKKEIKVVGNIYENPELCQA